MTELTRRHTLAALFAASLLAGCEGSPDPIRIELKLDRAMLRRIRRRVWREAEADVREIITEAFAEQQRGTTPLDRRAIVAMSYHMTKWVAPNASGAPSRAPMIGDGTASAFAMADRLTYTAEAEGARFSLTVTR